jgi:translation initiation factor eIF-2B subunit beta
MYKLTPMYPFDPMKLNELLAPSTIMRYEDGDTPSNIEAIVPAYDYVSPDFISLYITNQGGFTPNYIYRQFSDQYSKEEKYEDVYN